MDLSIVIPVYKSAEILPLLVKEIEMKVKFVKNFELIFVNDASPDSSWKVICQLKKKSKFIRGINLMRNFSQHNAIMAGLNEARGDIIVMMDDDLQHSPEDIKKMYEKMINDKLDVCYAQFFKKKHALWKNIGSRFNDIIANILLNKPKGVYLSPFKVINRKICDLVVQYKGPYPYIDGIILSVVDHKRIGLIDLNHYKRVSGFGNYTLFKSISLLTKMATGFSVLPLRISAYIGFIICCFSFLLAIIYFIQKLIFDALPVGFTTVILLILFFGGGQLMCLGIIGEYIGRMYLNVNSKTQYAIRDRV